MAKYKNINYVTLIAMFLIINIHFFNEFNKNVSEQMYQVMIFLRGFALPAVTLYLTNTAFTSFYLKKGVNYKSLYVFILIPTLLLTQIQHYMFGMNPVSYTFADGFNDSWFGEMYLYVMLLVPGVLYLDNKSKLTRNIMLIVSVGLTVWGYWYSIVAGSATISNLNVAMMFPYVGLTYFMYRIIEIAMLNMKRIEQSWKIKLVLLLLIIVSGLFEMAGYSGLLSPGIYAKSYFSPFTITFAVSVWVLIYSLDLSKLPAVRIITKSSYFLFFVHWILIRAFENYAPQIPVDHLWLTYVIVIISSYLISTILFAIYELLALKVLKL